MAADTLVFTIEIKDEDGWYVLNATGYPAKDYLLLDEALEEAKHLARLYFQV